MRLDKVIKSKSREADRPDDPAEGVGASGTE
jgi:hypothetical protein